MDGAVPSAQSLAVTALLRLGALTGEVRHLERAEEILRLLGPVAAQHPTSFGHLLCGLDLFHHGPIEVVVTGDRPDLVDTVRSQFRPHVVLAWGERAPTPLWEGRDDGFAYVCRRSVCRRPVADPEDLEDELDTKAERTD
jgi:uncharacterized protein YyaL (SSP411 family)